MKYLNEIVDGEYVTEHYLCKQLQRLKTRNGKNYISLKLQDKTALVDAKVWDINNEIEDFDEMDFVKVDAQAVTFQENIQLNIRRIRRSFEGEYFPENYIPQSKKDINVLYDKLIYFIEKIEDKALKEVLRNIFVNNEDIVEAFKTHSAAKAMHHAYMGGLLEHTVSVLEISEFLAPRYNFVNQDILLASAMLHDIGKLFELSPFPINDYTDEGQLLGHIMIGSNFFADECKKVEGISKEMQNLIIHCLISHHGEYEYGSPKLPKTIEAFILHTADNGDAKIKFFEEQIEQDQSKSKWLDYNRMLGRRLRKSID